TRRQRRAVAAVRKFPQGTAPAPRPAVPRGRVQGARAARREWSAKEARPQSIGVKARSGHDALVVHAVETQGARGRLESRSPMTTARYVSRAIASGSEADHVLDRGGPVPGGGLARPAIIPTL